jgi:hypothetical protein
MRSIADVVAATRRRDITGKLSAPAYEPNTYTQGGPNLAFMVASMQRHMTDEGYQIALALKEGGYWLCGEGFNGGSGDVLLTTSQTVPRTVVLQDKREWIGSTAGPGFDQKERFTNVEALRERDDIFKLTVLKDAHADQVLHYNAAQEIGCHAWITYYHPDLVEAHCPAVRKQHLVRTYHSIDADIVPDMLKNPRAAGVISGAVSMAYPLRSRLMLEAKEGRMSNVEWYRHPGYGRNHCHTGEYLNMLSGYRVAICTSSRFGYAVRKIIEATACGCIVVTDLPKDEVLPEIDGNLVRIDPDISPQRVDWIVKELALGWTLVCQDMWAERAKRFYDYRALGKKLAADIETMRKGYNS